MNNIIQFALYYLVVGMGYLVFILTFRAEQIRKESSMIMPELREITAWVFCGLHVIAWPYWIAIGTIGMIKRYLFKWVIEPYVIWKVKRFLKSKPELWDKVKGEFEKPKKKDNE